MPGPDDDKENFKDHLRKVNEAMHEFRQEEHERLNNKTIIDRILVKDLGDRMLFKFLIDMEKNFNSPELHRELIFIFMGRLWPKTKKGNWVVKAEKDRIEILQFAEDNIHG